MIYIEEIFAKGWNQILSFFVRIQKFEMQSGLQRYRYIVGQVPGLISDVQLH